MKPYATIRGMIVARRRQLAGLPLRYVPHVRPEPRSWPPLQAQLSGRRAIRWAKAVYRMPRSHGREVTVRS